MEQSAAPRKKRATGPTGGVTSPTRDAAAGSAVGPTTSLTYDAHGALDYAGLSASLEDYLEVILHLERESRVARVSEIAQHLKVSRPSVTGALKNLAVRGLVVHAKYGHVTLTETGIKIAFDVERRHLAIRDFLTGVLKIPEERAEATACRLEHVLEPDVLRHFVSYAESVAEGERKQGVSV